MSRSLRDALPTGGRLVDGTGNPCTPGDVVAVDLGTVAERAAFTGIRDVRVAGAARDEERAGVMPGGVQRGPGGRRSAW